MNVKKCVHTCVGLSSRILLFRLKSPKNLGFDLRRKKFSSLPEKNEKIIGFHSDQKIWESNKNWANRLRKKKLVRFLKNPGNKIETSRD